MAMNGKPTPHIVIIGAGFGGLNAALKLIHHPVRITIIDRRNHHTFQPLLYQVATAGLSPGEIASPIRWIFVAVTTSRSYSEKCKTSILIDEW